MTDRRLPDRSAVRELADRLTERQRVPLHLTGSSTPGGRDRDTRRTGLPLPIGDEGQVVTVVDVDGDLVPQWADPPGLGLAGFQYRQYVLVSDGSGGFDFIDDGFGNPVTSLEDLE